LVIWIARPRIDHEATFRASASRTFNAAASIVLAGVVAAGAVVTALEAAADLIALVAAALAAAALAVAGSEAGDEQLMS
jgi:hypothetical protein